MATEAPPPTEQQASVVDAVSHTPGPWSVGTATGHNASNVYHGDDSIASVYGIALHSTVEDVSGNPMWTEGLANARLIAAAPDLLETMRRMAQGWANAIERGLIPAQHVTAATILRDEAQTAIAKATTPTPLEELK